MLYSTSIRTALLDRLLNQAEHPVQGVSLFHSINEQNLRAIPVQKTTLLLVISGTKYIQDNECYIVHEGKGIIIPAGRTITLSNLPSPDVDHYLAVAVSITPDLAKQYYSFADQVVSNERLPSRHSSVAHSQMLNLETFNLDEPIQILLQQWIDSSNKMHLSDIQLTLKTIELLSMIAEHIDLSPFLSPRQRSWKERVLEHIEHNVAHPWTLEEICRLLATSPSSLRRHLAVEGTGFRDILEETRLLHGLVSLQETFWPINQIALSVGYQSQSRFSERFKNRFGVSPSALRQTRRSIDTHGHAS